MTDYPRLNLPPLQAKIEQREAGQYYIFDEIRKKWLWLSPEEWVRQHIIGYLVQYKNYPKALIKLEGASNYGKLTKRSDILVYNTMGQVHMLIECKAPHVKLSKHTLAQILQYQKKHQARIIGLSNGLEHSFMQIIENSLHFLEDIEPYKV